jgi:hypothetical protein
MFTRTLRASLWLLVLLLGAFVQRLDAQAPAVGSPGKDGVPIKIHTGFFDGAAVQFTAFETNSQTFAAANSLAYALRLSSSNPAALPNMIFFPNVGAPQTVVLQTQPGRADYSPLWNVLTARWLVPGKVPLITSYAAALQWNRAGRLLLQRTGIIFNGPVVWVNMTLNRQGGQLAPTISPGEFLGIDLAQRMISLRPHTAYFAGQQVIFLSLEAAPGASGFAPGALPVPTIGLDRLATTPPPDHDPAANLYDIPGQPPVIDSVPIQQTTVSPAMPATPTTTTPVSVYGAVGIAGKSTTIPAQQTAGNTGQSQVGGAIGFASPYSPIWHVHHVVFQKGVTPVVLHSVQEIEAAASAGTITVTAGDVTETFNCPVVTMPQPIPTTISSNPPAGGTPTPNPGGTTTPPVVTPPPTGGTTPPAPTVSFSTDILRIFTNNSAKTCAQVGCHSGANPTGGQNLEAGRAYASIVNVLSLERPDLKRVMPGDATNSYLFQKVTGASGIVGSSMPLAGGPLSAADIDLLRQWINGGAPNN